MNIKDLITDHATGRLSHTKLWSNVANATFTGIVIYMTGKGTLSSEILLIYVAFVGASRTASQYLAMRHATSTTNKATPAATLEQGE